MKIQNLTKIRVFPWNKLGKNPELYNTHTLYAELPATSMFWSFAEKKFTSHFLPNCSKNADVIKLRSQIIFLPVRTPEHAKNHVSDVCPMFVAAYWCILHNTDYK